MTLSDLRVIAVVGPTAVGKTELSENLALALNGEIVSADSMQLYRGLNVGTAKPQTDSRRVPYHCLDLIEPGEPFSAAIFQNVARTAITEIGSRGKVPIVAGGTGLYVRAALDTMDFPPGDQRASDSRGHYEEQALLGGTEQVYQLLLERDPSSADLIHPNNVRRVVRALEMLDEGVSYAQQHAGFARRESIYDVAWIGLTMDRPALYERINRRVDTMIEQGLLTEVELLMREGFREALTAAQAIGYKELVPVVEGRADLGTAIAAIKQASRRYAKRQLTWFRGDPRIIWIDVTELSTEQATQSVFSALDWR